MEFRRKSLLLFQLVIVRLVAEGDAAAARDNGHGYAEFFMKRMERGEQEPPSVLLASTRLLYHMGNIFRDNAPAPAANGVQIDPKRLG